MAKVSKEYSSEYTPRASISLRVQGFAAAVVIVAATLAGIGLITKRGELASLEARASVAASLMDNAPMPVISCDADMNIVQFNLEAVAMTGFSKEDVLGRNVSVIIPEAFRSRHQEVAGRTGPSAARMLGSLPVLRQDGSTVTKVIHVRRVVVGGQTWMIATFLPPPEESLLKQEKAREWVRNLQQRNPAVDIPDLE